MNSSQGPIVGPGIYQWSKGRWFGPLLGSSLWMLVTSILLIVNGRSGLAFVPAAGFAVVLIAAAGLWSLRFRLKPFPALMMALGLLAVTVPIVWYLVGSNASPETLNALNWPTSAWVPFMVYAIVPALMLWLLAQEKMARPGNP